MPKSATAARSFIHNFYVQTTMVYLQANFPGKSGKGIINLPQRAHNFVRFPPGNSRPLTLVLFQGLADMPTSVPLLLCIIILFRNGL